MQKLVIALFLLCLAVPAHATVQLVGKNSGTGNTMTLPSVGGGILSGDVIIAGVQGDCAHLPAAFTTIRSMQPNCGNVTSLWAYYRVSPGSEPSSYTITANAGETTAAWDVRVYRGVSAWPLSTWNPVEGGNGGGPNTTLNLPGSPGTTTGLPGEVFVGFFAWDCGPSVTSTFTPPPAMGNGDNVSCVNPGPVTNFGIYGGDLTKSSPGVVANQVGTISATTARAYTIGFTLVPAPSWSPQFINSTTGNNSVAIPSGTLSGHLMVLWCADYNRNPGDPVAAGWTRATFGGGCGTSCGGGAPPSQNFTNGIVWTKVASGSDVTVTFSGTPQNQSCILATYAGISGVDAFSTCYSGSTCQTVLTAPTVTTHNDIVVQMLASGFTNISASTGAGGEASASGGSIPDPIALIPAFLRQNVAFTGSGGGGGHVGLSLCDYPFYGALTNTPYTSQGNTVDIAVALALKPTSQPVPPSASGGTAYFMP